MRFYDWRLEAIRDGKGFHVTIGTLTTGILGGGAGTIIDLDQPEFALAIPSLTTVIPLRIHVQCEPPLIAADSDIEEIIIAYDKDVAVASGTGTVETAFNMWNGHAKTSACTATSAFTVNITVEPTEDLELARAQLLGDVQGTAGNALYHKLDLLYEPVSPPFLVGPSSLLIYWGGVVAMNGFAQIEWLEFATTDVTA